MDAGHILNNLGNNYQKSGEYSKAAECYDRALAIYTEQHKQKVNIMQLLCITKEYLIISI